MTSSEIYWEIFVVILIYAGVSAAIFFILFVVDKIARCIKTSRQPDDTDRSMKKRISECFEIIFCGQEQTISDTSTNQLRSSRQADYQATSDSQSGSGQPSSSPGMDPQASNTRNIEDIDGEVDSSDVAHLHVDEREADVTRNQTVEAPLDTVVSTRSYNETAKVCLWILGTIILFYGLPAVQLVLTYPKKMSETGDEDLCYYNFECAYPGRWLGYEIRSSNSIISNIGYVFLGILFIFLVFLRHRQYIRHVLENSTRQNHNGMPKHFGLLYAMGCALIVEGVMSACYHICPTYSNYQFDTSFMYVITSLCILKIYESRHPDAQLKAHRHYFCMGVYTCIAVLGIIFDEHWGVWIVYAVLHIACVGLVVRFVSKKGIIEGDQHQTCSNCCPCTCPTEKSTFKAWLVFLVIFNVTGAMVGGIKQKPDFATYLLIILLVNLVWYLVLHIVFERCSDGWNDKGSWICRLIFFIVAAITMWIWAFSRYAITLSSWELSPEESRKENKPCVWRNFYDYHDVWHFLSAGAIFFSFMVLLTLDDDLDDRPRNTIFIF